MRATYIRHAHAAGKVVEGLVGELLVEEERGEVRGVTAPPSHGPEQSVKVVVDERPAPLAQGPAGAGEARADGERREGGKT